MRRILITALLSLTLPAAHAASFDCKEARTPREHAVCSDPKLSALDDQLAAAYKAASSKLSPAAFALVQSDQREWLSWLDETCKPNSSEVVFLPRCLTNAYQERLQQLTTGLQKINGITFYPRARFLYVVTGTPSNENPYYDPNVGRGSFNWPQIDQPTPQQQLWSKQLEAAIVALLLGKEAGARTLTEAFRTAAEPGTEVDLSYRIHAANQRFIATGLSNYTFTGGAHGGTSEINVLWWLDKGRPLLASDVLLPGSNWQQKLIDPAISKLQTDSGPDAIWKGDELRQGVTQGIADIRSWTLDSTGLTITFGQYQVGPYSSGMPQITFTWDELRPYLNPALHPETLPPPVPKP
ncbi:MAG TPA: DUF3298 domain-containing protein [Edaphobacter sp.]